MELYGTVFLSFVLIVVSAVCSGLNVALMSLDVRELRHKAQSGDKHARAALAIRKNTHLSLAAILLTNVAVISATSLVLSGFLNGIIAGLVSTLLIVVFGEILPQAFAVKHALAAVAFFSPFLKFITYVSYPLSKPLQWLLDRMVGEGAESLHTRRELGMIIADHHDERRSELDDDEVEIVQNALLLSEKRVSQIMTPIKQAVVLTTSQKLSERKVTALRRSGFSRIPIMNSRKTRTERFILLKDLIDVDFDGHSYALDDVKTRPMQSVGAQTALDTMFRTFTSAKTHIMAVEQRGKLVGIVTIEDLLEEIIGHEIQDETD